MTTNPIHSLKVKKFGPFEELNLRFSPQLNVIVGDNSTGKSQLLKLLYACSHVLQDENVESKTETERAVAEKLSGVFKPDRLGRLANRLRGATSASVDVKYRNITEPLSFHFSTRSRSDVSVARFPDLSLPDVSAFLPSRELLSIYPGLVSLYENREVAFDETWRDTAQLLSLPSLRGPREQRAREILKALVGSLSNASVVEEGGSFYLRQAGVGKIEANLAAEGHRKLAMILRLVTSGTLLDSGYLFWDEPEANLNPIAQRSVAIALRELATNGAQIFVATHSAFLAREIEMRVKSEVKTQYISLYREGLDVTDGSTLDSDSLDNISGVVGATSNSIRNLTNFAALDAEFHQSLEFNKFKEDHPLDD